MQEETYCKPAVTSTDKLKFHVARKFGARIDCVRLRSGHEAPQALTTISENIAKTLVSRLWFRYIRGMDYLASAADALQNAEESLRDLAAKAATGGDYASVMLIASWAQAVKDIPGGKPTGCSDRAGIAIANGSRRVFVSAKASKRTGRKKSSDEYPKFFRHGDQLIRVAWSKRDRSEYQHKTSQAILRQFADTLSSAGKEGRVFSTDEILPLQDVDGQPVPAYQVYVCIALLKQAGLIDQHGRQGYSLTRGEDLKKAIDSIWRSLSEKLPRRPS